MSEFKVEVVEVKLEPHPNADSLSLVNVFDFPVCVRTADWKDGDLAAYIPVDSVVPQTEQFAFLQNRRIKAKKLRGIFSQGLLVPAPEGAVVGANVAQFMEIEKYEASDDPERNTRLGGAPGVDEATPPPISEHQRPSYTDIEPLRRYRPVLDEKQGEEEVVVMEKIHGANGRFLALADNDTGDITFYAGSRKQWKKAPSIWWTIADRYQLFTRIRPGYIVFGEVYGWVQDLRYGAEPGEVKFKVFDIFDIEQAKYLDFNDLWNMTSSMQLELAPIDYIGPFDYDKILELAEAPSKIDGAIREGVVVRPVTERWHPRVGRVILKVHGQGYLLRAEKPVPAEVAV